MPKESEALPQMALQLFSQGEKYSLPLGEENLGKITRFNCPLASFKDTLSIDIAAPLGSAVYSVADGLVVETNESKIPGNEKYGKYVIIENSSKIRFFYAHLESIRVKKGDKITAGQEIAFVGITGNSTGAHLHFELMGRDGNVQAELKAKLDDIILQSTPKSLNEFLGNSVYLRTLTESETEFWSNALSNCQQILQEGTYEKGYDKAPFNALPLGGYNMVSSYSAADYEFDAVFDAPRGTAIHVVLNGTVTQAESNEAWGNFIKVDHGGGLETTYKHCDTPLVKKGDTVKRGDVIAHVSSTGRSAGNQLGFEIELDENKTNTEKSFSQEELAALLDSEILLVNFDNVDEQWINLRNNIKKAFN